MRQSKFFPGIMILMLFSCEADDVREPILVEENFSSELFFSEYIEGSSFNKALEIVNLTGETVDLEAEEYSIRKQSNGSGNWIGEVFLIGSLAHNDVFVIANESADIPEIIENANQLKTGAPMDFNGNDPVGLFKNNVLIDVIGVVDDPEDFGKDITLRRSNDITEPSTTFDLEDWQSFEQNNVEDLGEY